MCAMTENSKELVSLGMLLESVLDGIPLSILGTPAVYNWDLPLGFAQRRDGRDQLKLDGGLLRRVRHIELRAKYIQMLVEKKHLLLEHIPDFKTRVPV